MANILGSPCNNYYGPKGPVVRRSYHCNAAGQVAQKEHFPSIRRAEGNVFRTFLELLEDFWVFLATFLAAPWYKLLALRGRGRHFHNSCCPGVVFLGQRGQTGFPLHRCFGRDSEGNFANFYLVGNMKNCRAGSS